MLHIKVARIHFQNDLNEIMDSIYHLVTFLSFSMLNLIIQNVRNSFLKRVGEAKILSNIKGGLDEMLIIAYVVDGWVQKSPKTCLRKIWTIPKAKCFLGQVNREK